MAVVGWVALTGAISWCGVLGGCEVTQPAPMEPFQRHRLDSLSRALDSARVAQEQSRDDLGKALDENDIDGAASDTTRRSLEFAYDRARHDLAMCQTRVRVAGERLKQATRRGDDLFAEWDKEIGYYADDALRRQARLGYDQSIARYNEALDKLDAANDSGTPLLVELSDRMLFFKHHRDQPEVVQPARTPEIVAHMQRVRLQMDAATAAASAAVARFVEAAAGAN